MIRNADREDCPGADRPAHGVAPEGLDPEGHEEQRERGCRDVKARRAALVVQVQHANHGDRGERAGRRSDAPSEPRRQRDDRGARQAVEDATPRRRIGAEQDMRQGHDRRPDRTVEQELPAEDGGEAAAGPDVVADPEVLPLVETREAGRGQQGKEQEDDDRPYRRDERDSSLDQVRWHGRNPSD